MVEVEVGYYEEHKDRDVELDEDEKSVLLALNLVLMHICLLLLVGLQGRMKLSFVAQKTPSSKQTLPQMKSFSPARMVILPLCMM